MDADKPFFRFNPLAYDSEEILKSSSELCDVCGRPCEWRYVGVIWANAPVACARCLADGRLAAWLRERGYPSGMHDCQIEDDVDPALLDEAMDRTPTFPTFYMFTWPVLDHRPLAFVGHGAAAGIWENPAARTAMKEAWSAFMGELDAPTLHLLVFREIDGCRFVAVVDMDPTPPDID